MEFNKYQTPIDQLVYKKIDDKTGNFQLISFKDSPEEVQNEFMEALSTVPLIQWLISKDRPLCGELPRDENGKAIWKIEYPPIIENVDYFRQTAIHYENTGKLTDLRPNPNPNSAYSKWKDEEVDRIRNGMLRPDDGAWIPGYMYFYLNYCPIILTEVSEGNADVGDRVVGFPSWWEGLLWRFTGWDLARKLGRYFFEISKRGSSKSYGMASGLARGFVIGDRKPDPKHKSFTRGVVLADNKDFLIKDGTLNKFESMIDFLAQNTEFPRKRLKSSLNEMAWTMGYIDLNTGTKKGSGNEVLGVAIKDDPDKARGKRASLFCLEEIGKFPNLATTMKISERSVKDGNIVFGLLVGVGTGGEEGNDFSGALDLIYHPTGSNVLAFENVWDKAAQSRGTSIFCFPAYVNRLGCYNKDGISDVTLALFQICWERYIAKYENPDPMAITRTKAEDPITLQDAIMKRDGTKFPVAQITERIQEIDLNPNFYDKILSGKLIQRSNGEVEFEPTGDKPIHKFPTKDNKVTGAVEIKELPKKNREGRVYSGRYIGGLDPIDDDSANTMSLVSVFILDLWTDEIVAEWTGRLNTAEDCYEMIRLLLKFYNAKVMYEAHPYSQKTITPEGEKLWKDIKVGDTLFAPNNEIVKVVDIPIDEYMPIYEVTLRDGRTIQASGNHIWSVYTINHRDAPVLMTTEEMLSCGIKTKYNQTNFFIPNGGKVEFEHKDVSIDPYTMGLIIAEGALTKFNIEKKRKRKRNHVQISSYKEDAAFYKTVIPYSLKYIGTKGYSWHLEIEDIDKRLKDLGLLGTNSHTKFLPDIYLYNDYTTRIELLRGLMDGDGYAGKEGSSVFVTASQKLAKDIMSLCRSLGINCSCRHVKNGNFENYRVTIYTSEPIFKLPRKVSNLHEYSPKAKGSKASSYLDKTAITDIRFSHYEMGKCVTVDSEDGLYMVGDYVVTHNCNKKGIYSYFKMMNSLYLLAETPEFIKDREDSKVEKIGNKMYGINATNPINNYGRDRLKDFMLKPKEITKVIDGQEQTVTIPNVMTWWNRALLEEARGWNPDGNFDRISAMGMLMLYREEVLVVNHGEINRNERTVSQKVNDPFFERNYHPKTLNKPVFNNNMNIPSTAEHIQWWGQ